MTKHSKTLLISLVVLVVLVGGAAWGYQGVTSSQELDQIASTFTCTADREPILTSEAICADGFKARIRALQTEGSHGHDLFVRTATLMGLPQIIDETLRGQTYLDFVQDPPSERANLTLDTDYVNLGNVSESRVAFTMKEFTITNTGTAELFITAIGTSCSCLSAKVIKDDVESPTMSRFSDPHGMLISLMPGEQARLRVTYDARVNSFFRGAERRYVYLSSNDPIEPSQQITLDVIHSD